MSMGEYMVVMALKRQFQNNLIVLLAKSVRPEPSKVMYHKRLPMAIAHPTIRTAYDALTVVYTYKGTTSPPPSSRFVCGDGRGGWP